MAAPGTTSAGRTRSGAPRVRFEPNLLTMLERRVMEAEYWLDSSIMHVRRKGCRCIGPLMLARLDKATSAIRGARDRVRNAAGVKQWTLFAGAGGDTQRGRGKNWAHNTAHRWAKDCDDACVCGDSTDRRYSHSSTACSLRQEAA